jgi:hypothetical protein
MLLYHVSTGEIKIFQTNSKGMLFSFFSQVHFTTRKGEVKADGLKGHARLSSYGYELWHPAGAWP